MEKIQALNDFLVVRIEKEEEGGSRITIANDKTNFSIGKIVSGELPDLDYVVAEGMRVIFPTDSASPVGLGFGDDVYVLAYENVVGYITEED